MIDPPRTCRRDRLEALHFSSPLINWLIRDIFWTQQGCAYTRAKRRAYYARTTFRQISGVAEATRQPDPAGPPHPGIHPNRHRQPEFDQELHQSVGVRAHLPVREYTRHPGQPPADVVGVALAGNPPIAARDRAQLIG